MAIAYQHLNLTDVPPRDLAEFAASHVAHVKELAGQEHPGQPRNIERALHDSLLQSLARLEIPESGDERPELVDRWVDALMVALNADNQLGVAQEFVKWICYDAERMQTLPGDVRRGLVRYLANRHPDTKHWADIFASNTSNPGARLAVPQVMTTAPDGRVSVLLGNFDRPLEQSRSMRVHSKPATGAYEVAQLLRDAAEHREPTSTRRTLVALTTEPPQPDTVVRLLDKLPLEMPFRLVVDTPESARQILESQRIQQQLERDADKLGLEPSFADGLPATQWLAQEFRIDHVHDPYVRDNAEALLVADRHLGLAGLTNDIMDAVTFGEHLAQLTSQLVERKHGPLRQQGRIVQLEECSEFAQAFADLLTTIENSEHVSAQAATAAVDAFLYSGPGIAVWPASLVEKALFERANFWQEGAIKEPVIDGEEPFFGRTVPVQAALAYAAVKFAYRSRPEAETGALRDSRILAHQLGAADSASSLPRGDLAPRFVAVDPASREITVGYSRNDVALPELVDLAPRPARKRGSEFAAQMDGANKVLAIRGPLAGPLAQQYLDHRAGSDSGMPAVKVDARTAQELRWNEENAPRFTVEQVPPFLQRTALRQLHAHGIPVEVTAIPVTGKLRQWAGALADKVAPALTQKMLERYQGGTKSTARPR